MRVTTGALVLTLALGCATAVPSLAQDAEHRGDQPQAQQQDRYRDQAQPQDRDRDQRSDPDRAQDRDQDRDRRVDQDHDRDRHDMDDNDRAFFGNKFFQQGWKDGLKHKHKNKKFKNDEDRRAYEAGFAHGERGEAWHKPGKGDHDRDRDHDQDRH